jgi:hypothetical protein
MRDAAEKRIRKSVGPAEPPRMVAKHQEKIQIKLMLFTMLNTQQLLLSEVHWSIGITFLWVAS